MKGTIIPIVMGALGRVTKGLLKGLVFWPKLADPSVYQSLCVSIPLYIYVYLYAHAHL